MARHIPARQLQARSIEVGHKTTRWRWPRVASILALMCGLIPGFGKAHPTSEVEATALGQVHTDDRLVDPLSYRGQTARGLYFTGPYVKRFGVQGVLKTVQGAGMNAAVIDLKDGEGRVLYDTQLEVLQEQKRVMLGDARSLVQTLRESGIYTIARIVCFSDPSLPLRHPERAIMDNRPNKRGQVWASWGGRNTWLDPYNEANHDLIVALAREAQELGFDEVQLDYFRFPVDEATRFASYPAQQDLPRREVLSRLLRRIDLALTIPLGVDVFGLTAFRHGDPAGLGQSLDDWALHLEVFSPMLYVNNMTRWMRDSNEQRALRLVAAGVGKLRERLGYGPVIRPFLQAFSAGADYYDAEFIAEQINGARRGDADGFLFWNPAANYALVRTAMAGAARALVPFPIEARSDWRRQAWSDAMSPLARASYQRALKGSELNAGEPMVEASDRQNTEGLRPL